MALVLNDEQTMLRDNARGFLAKNAPIAHLRALRDNRDADGFSRALWKNFVEMGWAGILVPQDYGGLGLGHVEAGVVAEELGRTLTPSPFLSTAVLAATAIARAGNDKQKENLSAENCRRRIDRDAGRRRNRKASSGKNRDARRLAPATASS